MRLKNNKKFYNDEIPHQKVYYNSVKQSQNTSQLPSNVLSTQEPMNSSFEQNNSSLNIADINKEILYNKQRLMSFLIENNIEFQESNPNEYSATVRLINENSLNNKFQNNITINFSSRKGSAEQDNHKEQEKQSKKKDSLNIYPLENVDNINEKSQQANSPNNFNISNVNGSQIDQNERFLHFLQDKQESLQKDFNELDQLFQINNSDESIKKSKEKKINLLNIHKKITEIYYKSPNEFRMKVINQLQPIQNTIMQGNYEDLIQNCDLEILYSLLQKLLLDNCNDQTMEDFVDEQIKIQYFEKSQQSSPTSGGKNQVLTFDSIKQNNQKSTSRKTSNASRKKNDSIASRKRNDSNASRNRNDSNANRNRNDSNANRNRNDSNASRNRNDSKESISRGSNNQKYDYKKFQQIINSKYASSPKSTENKDQSLQEDIILQYKNQDQNEIDYSKSEISKQSHNQQIDQSLNSKEEDPTLDIIKQQQVIQSSPNQINNKKELNQFGGFGEIKSITQRKDHNSKSYIKSFLNSTYESTNCSSTKDSQQYGRTQNSIESQSFIQNKKFSLNSSFKQGNNLKIGNIYGKVYKNNNQQPTKNIDFNNRSSEQKQSKQIATTQDNSIDFTASNTNQDTENIQSISNTSQFNKVNIQQSCKQKEDSKKQSKNSVSPPKANIIQSNLNPQTNASNRLMKAKDMQKEYNNFKQAFPSRRTPNQLGNAQQLKVQDMKQDQEKILTENQKQLKQKYTRNQILGKVYEKIKQEGLNKSLVNINSNLHLLSTEELIVYYDYIQNKASALNK